MWSTGSSRPITDIRQRRLTNFTQIRPDGTLVCTAPLHLQRCQFAFTDEERNVSHLPFEEWSDQIARSVQTLNEDMHTLKVNSATDKQVEALIQLQEKQMTNQASYTNLIMVAGYAGYFAFWSTLVTKMPQWVFALCGLLMTLTLTLFIAWEIIKAFWTGRYFHQVQEILGKPRGSRTLSELQAVGSKFSAKGRRWWIWFFATSVITGLSAATVLIIYFAVELVKTMITAFCAA